MENDAEPGVATYPLVIGAASSWLLILFSERNPEELPPISLQVLFLLLARANQLRITSNPTSVRAQEGRIKGDGW